MIIHQAFCVKRAASRHRELARLYQQLKPPPCSAIMPPEF